MKKPWTAKKPPEDQVYPKEYKLLAIVNIIIYINRDGVNWICSLCCRTNLGEVGSSESSLEMATRQMDLTEINTNSSRTVIQTTDSSSNACIASHNAKAVEANANGDSSLGQPLMSDIYNKEQLNKENQKMSEHAEATVTYV